MMEQRGTESAGPTRVLLVDDHIALREPLAFMFDREPDFKVVACAGSLREARTMLKDVDLAVLDLDLPDGLGTDIVDELLAASPGALPLVLTGMSEKVQLALAIEAGAAGVLEKSSSGTRDIVEAARKLQDGEQLLSPHEVIEAMRFSRDRRRSQAETTVKLERLTPRERDVLAKLAEGLSDKVIAQELHLGVGTVRTHMAKVLQKLEVDSRLQALVLAVRSGFVSIDT